jgi:membrane-bound inhibitor of C-type lysozyme
LILPEKVSSMVAQRKGGGRMQARWKRFILRTAWGIAGGIAALGSSPVAAATDLTIHLDGSEPLTRQTVQYQCNAEGVAMGLPVTSFSVEYINGAGNSLAIVPIHGTSLIFADISSGSGARYTAKQYTWWEAGGAVNFYSDSLKGKMQSSCHRVYAK